MKSDHSARKPRKLSRRNLLELAGWTIGAAAFPSPPVFALNPAVQDRAAKPTGPVMNPLSTYMSGAVSNPLPDEITEKAKHHILDTLAAMISGSTLLPGKRALNLPRHTPRRETPHGSRVRTVARSDRSCDDQRHALPT
jgi:hypothetical protein